MCWLVGWARSELIFLDFDIFVGLDVRCMLERGRESGLLALLMRRASEGLVCGASLLEPNVAPGPFTCFPLDGPLGRCGTVWW